MFASSPLFVSAEMKRKRRARTARTDTNTMKSEKKTYEGYGGYGKPRALYPDIPRGTYPHGQNDWGRRSTHVRVGIPTVAGTATVATAGDAMADGGSKIRQVSKTAIARSQVRLPSVRPKGPLCQIRRISLAIPAELLTMTTLTTQLTGVKA